MKRMTISLTLSIISILLSVSFASVSMAQSAANVSEEEHKKDIITKLGTVHIGMTEAELYQIFQENDRILIPKRMLDKEWHVFRDWTSKNPNDVITFYLKNGRVIWWEKQYNPSPANKGSAYEYKPGEKIDKWFFPPSKARWDGSKLKLLDWHKLVRAQKVTFILEYIKQVNETFGSNISVDVDRYILGIDYDADIAIRSWDNVLVAEAVNELLISEGKAKPKP